MLLDIQSILPHGLIQPANPHHSMNFRGEVLLEGQDPNTGEYSYLLYDGDKTTTLYSTMTRLIAPTLADDGTVYYLTSNGSTYSLNSLVPEPGSLSLIFMVVGAGVMRRRRRR